MKRRQFLERSLAAGVGAGLAGASFGAEGSRGEQGKINPETDPIVKPGGMPMGRIKNLEISRLICGGNLIGGWAHARDLIYVSDLMQRYNTERKIFETLQQAEELGINAIIVNPKYLEVVNKYWKQTGGKIRIISECHPKEDDLFSGLQEVIDHGPSAVYVQGGVGDQFHEAGKTEKLGEVIDRIRSQGLPAGLGAHCLELVMESEVLELNPDFYVKTLHTKDYWSAQRPEQEGTPVLSNPRDNYWCTDPEGTIQYMRGVQKPWIAFKVLAAGAIHPREGFPHAFIHGADFICVGMFDWQLQEDVAIVREAVEQARAHRARPWLA